VQLIDALLKETGGRSKQPAVAKIGFVLFFPLAIDADGRCRGSD
jgi:hypothetical protein